MSGDASAVDSDLGDASQQEFEDMMGDDYSSATAVYLYGMTGFAVTIVTTVIYMLFDDKTYVVASKGFHMAHLKAWFPVAWSWLLLSFFDNEFTRALMFLAVMWSFKGPFVDFWTEWGLFFLAFEGSDDSAKYIWFVIHGAANLFEMLWIALVVPGVYDWLENAEYVNPESEWDEEDEENVEDEADEGY